MDDKELLICECNNVEHQLVISYDEEDNQAYLYVHLVKQFNIFQRIWHAIKYIAGFKSKQGDFDVFILGDRYADNFKRLGDKLSKTNK